MNTTPIGTLEVGDSFLCPWREEGRNIGKILWKGIGSCQVKVPTLDGGSWETTQWALGTGVIPTTPDQMMVQSIGKTDRNRSAVESPVSRVHAMCEKMRGSTRDEIVAACVAEGINISTARTQYYVWRKSGR
jgi:hypothetical protein